MNDHAFRRRDVKEGRIQSIVDVLEERGFINQIAGYVAARNLLRRQGIS